MKFTSHTYPEFYNPFPPRGINHTIETVLFILDFYNKWPKLPFFTELGGKGDHPINEQVDINVRFDHDIQSLCKSNFQHHTKM